MGSKLQSPKQIFLYSLDIAKRTVHVTEISKKELEWRVIFLILRTLASIPVCLERLQGGDCLLRAHLLLFSLPIFKFIPAHCKSRSSEEHCFLCDVLRPS